MLRAGGFEVARIIPTGAGFDVIESRATSGRLRR
jgi:hypothetical protein